LANPWPELQDNYALALENLAKAIRECRAVGIGLKVQSDMVHHEWLKHSIILVELLGDDRSTS
jgi:hypothetical protein